MALFAPHVKWAAARPRPCATWCRCWSRPSTIARSGVPGPVFVECPVDLLYDEELVREWYGASSKGGGIAGAGMRLYLKRHASQALRRGRTSTFRHRRGRSRRPLPDKGDVRKAAARLRKAKRPVLVLGSQVLLSSPTREEAQELARGDRRRSARRSTWPAAPAACSAPATRSSSGTSARRRCARRTSCSWPASPTTSGSTTAATSAARPSSSRSTGARTTCA